MSKKIFHIKDLKLDNRWEFPLSQIFSKVSKDIEVHIIEGEQTESVADSGSFTNFIDTHYFKNTQANNLFNLIKENKVPEGSVIFFDDAWNLNILQLKYIMDLLDLNFTIMAYWHAGVHDDFDFLGRLIKNKNWAFNTERALFEAINVNCFATSFYKDMFVNKVFHGYEIGSKILVTAQPHELLVEQLNNFPKSKKEDIIVFQHRLAVEKQPEIFRDLAASMPDVKFIICQESKLTKEEYYKIVSQAKISFSASNQETFGIACSIDAPMLNCIPIMPNRLSYSEIFKGYDDFLYPSDWTIDWDAYLRNKDKIISYMRHVLFEYYLLLPKLNDFCNNRLPQYTVPSKLIDTIISKF